MKEKIVIYTSKNCPYCGTIKEILEKESIKFEEKEITKFNSEWQEVNELTGIPTLPTILFNKEYLVPGRDFVSPDHLIVVINNSKKSKYNYDIRSFERIKSLNFNILTAFNQLQIVLNKIESKLNIEENEHKSTS